MRTEKVKTTKISIVGSSLKENLQKAEVGFSKLPIHNQYKESALSYLEEWLTRPDYEDYVPQVLHLIDQGYWDYLLDSFYQIIPFGTGGRRGEVGIGPNRINIATIQSSAQGHSQYLTKQYGSMTKKRGVVLAYDIRQFYSNRFFDDNIDNPVRNLTCKDLAIKAAEVYAANGLNVYFFESFRTTPELSFAIRFLKAAAGAMFSASHNPPEHNGKKVFDEFGGQLIPPYDEELVNEVTDNVARIKTISFKEAKEKDLVKIIGKKVDQAYLEACSSLSLSKERDVRVIFSPLHGCSLTSVKLAKERLGFKIKLCPKTSNPSGMFENVTFNIPNPEVRQSFDTTLEYANKVGADIVLNSDPDGDRIGVMVKHGRDWHYINGNEIGVILTHYVIKGRKEGSGGPGIIVKTDVTTNLITKICEANGVEVIGGLLVGFKYVSDVMNRLEREGRIGELLLACEESHGFVGGNYIREKDAVVPAIWLSELSATLKKKGKTLLDYLEEIYSQYGYFRNYLTEIRLPGAEGMSQIKKIQDGLRKEKPKKFGRFIVQSVEDWLDRKPIVSETDRVSKNGLVFRFRPIKGITSMRVTVRPSGTEPKIKMYFEIGSEPFDPKDMGRVRGFMELILQDLEREFMMVCYKIMGVNFPKRGFLLFWQLPLVDKLQYFKIETQVVGLRKVKNKDERRKLLSNLLAFLGSDPIKKIDGAFKVKYKKSVESFLRIK